MGVCGGSSSEHLLVNQGELIGTTVVNTLPGLNAGGELPRGETYMAEDTETEKDAWTKLS